MLQTVSIPWELTGKAVLFRNKRLHPWALNISINSFVSQHELRGDLLHLEEVQEGIYEIYRLQWADHDTPLEPTLEGFFLGTGYEFPPKFFHPYTRRR